ncbi:MAG: hypothetical protein LJE69_08610 [Thiohalocapsa sp.]|jgi:hypothetical protein|uniref:hypothetical protein n=1 Tax=Thiohalocapsa sp. TaxID=2497641 RepID=UPI0025CE6487|nr:hypothetical protein [Thiohalocapsa sp.]MCG6941298.1 hypothetical protein [Thiohalocapsa sp.]
MRYYLGAVCLLIGVWLIFLAMNHRKKVIAARERAEAAGNPQRIDPNLEKMGIAMMPFYAMYGAFASLLLIGGFFLSDLKQYLSVVDLLGLIVLVVGYSVFMVMKAAYSKLGLDMKQAA